MEGSFQLFLNPRFSISTPYTDVARETVSLDALELAWDEARKWPEYAQTPIHDLPKMATDLDVAQVLLKDESDRFGLGSFKAIGGTYGCLLAVQRELQDRGIEVDAAGLRNGRYQEETANIVLICATDGNHGRAVAWAARNLGCPCVVYVPSIVSEPRRVAIEAEGATVIRIDGTYDEAVRDASDAAANSGGLVVSDHSFPGYETIPRAIMQGYTIVIAELMQAIASQPLPTHVFVQAGVGGFAASICGYLWEKLGVDRPAFICVEPSIANCLYQSAAAGRLVTVPGDLDTVMGCLSCGEASTLGWSILRDGATAYMTISDTQAVTAMKALSSGGYGQQEVVLGESGIAGLAGLLAVGTDELAREQLGLDKDSRILLFGTEGANDPKRYQELVGSVS